MKRRASSPAPLAAGGDSDAGDAEDDEPSQPDGAAVPHGVLADATAAIADLAVPPVDTLRGELPQFKRPVQVAEFSLDAQRQFHAGASALRFYHEPEPSLANLSAGYNTYQARSEDVDEHLDHLLLAIQAASAPPAAQGEPPSLLAGTDFVTWRGILTRIMCTPYYRYEPWLLAVTRHRDTIYIEEPTAAAAALRSRGAPAQAERQRLMSYWGVKFEQYCVWPTRERPTLAQRQQHCQTPVNNSEAYCVVLRSRLGAHNLIFGAEVDCADPAAPIVADGLIELKTAKQPQTERDVYMFERHKLLKFWLQSFLAKVPTIVVGFRDDNGFLRGVQSYETLALPRLVRGKPGMWDPAPCMRFADQLLAWLRQAVPPAADGDRSTWLVEYVPAEGRVVLRPPQTPYEFLPPWFAAGPTARVGNGAQRVEHDGGLAPKLRRLL